MNRNNKIMKISKNPDEMSKTPYSELFSSFSSLNTTRRFNLECWAYYSYTEWAGHIKKWSINTLTGLRYFGIIFPNNSATLAATSEGLTITQFPEMEIIRKTLSDKMYDYPTMRFLA